MKKIGKSHWPWATGPLLKSMTRELKELATDIAPILTIIFQISLESGVVPSDWKTAHLAPVYKKGPKYKLYCITQKIIGLFP